MLTKLAIKKQEIITMIEQKIRHLAEKYRVAIEKAKDNGEFFREVCFDRFPTACCGDASCFLGMFLKVHGIETVWVSNQRKEWSHAWLIFKDDRVRKPISKSFSWPEEISKIIARYGKKWTDEKIDITRYEAEDLQEGLIIDITGDQFSDYDIPIYVGVRDAFHKSFEFNYAYDFEVLNDARLERLYRIIEVYIC